MGELKTQGQGESLKPDPAKAERDLETLLLVLAKLANQCDEWAEERDDAMRHHASGFAYKLVRHAASALTLVRERSAIGSQYSRFLDAPSVSTVARAGWESFLLFHHIFIDVADDDERTMRHRRWLVEGMRFRQRYDAYPEFQNLKKEELEKIRTWEAEIRANSAFKRLCPDDREDFLGHRRWHASWDNLATNAGIVKMFRHDHYSHLCDHAHSGPISVLNQKDDQEARRIDSLRISAAGILAIAVANVIVGLGALFPACRTPIEPEASRLVKFWVGIGQGSGD